MPKPNARTFDFLWQTTPRVFGIIRPVIKICRYSYPPKQSFFVIALRSCKAALGRRIILPKFRDGEILHLYNPGEQVKKYTVTQLE